MSGLRASASAAIGGTLLVLTACHTIGHQPKLQPVDLIIRGGTVYDGTLAAGARADVVVDDGKLVFVGTDAAGHYSGERVIEAGRLIVAPGFIDPHTHAEEDLASQDARQRANLAFAFQGVTTVVVGNDGFGSPGIARMAEEVRQARIGTNVAYLAGFGAIREAVLGTKNRAPDKAELARMQGLTRKAMCEGAWGLSGGLYYVPQSYAETDEVVALAAVAGTMGGYYDTHMRDESTYSIGVLEAVDESLEIGHRGGLPVHIAHIKALGPAVWGQSAAMIDKIEQARASGQHVTADQYPWEASGTRISNALVPGWALEGGLESLRERLGDADQRASIVAAMEDGLGRRGGAAKLLITGRLGNAEVEPGQTLAEIAAQGDLSPVEAAIAILRQGDARVASFNMDPADIAAFASRNWVVTGSDGSNGHPRKFASFPKAYRDLAVGGDMTLARFINRSSAQTADIVGLTDRGLLKPGYAADIVIFDAAAFAPRASYERPQEFSVGVRYLIINGQALISEGEYTGALPGVPLLKETSC